MPPSSKRDGEALQYVTRIRHHGRNVGDNRARNPSLPFCPFERLCGEHGYAGGITIVKDYVRAQRLQQRPLQHDPGHAQVDFGEALAEIARVERKVHFFAMDLPHSDACFVRAYPEETAEAFCDGHRRYRGADLTGAFLQGAQFLNCAQLVLAHNWQSAFRDDALGCGAATPDASLTG
jgi:hypothetical protein